MSGRRTLKRTLRVGNLLRVKDGDGVNDNIKIVYLEEPYDIETTKGGKTHIMREYIDAKIQFISGKHKNKEDNYDIIHDNKGGAITFTHKNRSNWHLPAFLYAEIQTSSNPISLSSSGRSSSGRSSSDRSSSHSSSSSSSSSSGGARRTKKSKKEKKGKKAKKSRYTRRH